MYGSAPSREEKQRTFRRRRLTAATVLVIVFVALLMGTALGAAHLTSGSGICQQCHEMQPYYQSWQQSAHKSVECAQCHIPSGTVGLLLAKIGALREVYVHIAGEEAMPLQVNSKVPRATCLSCHPKPTDATYASSSFTHTAHTSGACSDCHRGLFHPTAPPAKPVPAVAKLGTMDNCLTCHDGTTAPKTCNTCHKAPHKASGECRACHTPKSWSQPIALSASVSKEACLTCHPKQKDVTLKSSTFSHDAHKAETCADCHNKQLHPSKKSSTTVSMASCLTCHNGTRAPKTCSTCHKAPHAAFGECGLCHTAKNWTPVSAAAAVSGAKAAKAGFAHPFALNGRHATLKCASCHKTLGTGKAAAALPTKCVGCHGDKHKGLTDCTRCHKTSGWTPANFTHPGVSGMNWRGMACSDCHPNGYASHTCTKCHGGN
jgi:nitrate/TMAO reductase-like tetraheme cytochrome c subunit